MNTGKFDAHPTYKDDYRPWDTHKRELAKQERVYQPPTEKFGNSTTFQDDFFPKEIMARESFKPLGVAKHSDIPFEATTSHRISYVPHEIEPRFMKEKPEYKPSSQPLDDLTTHRVNFKGALGEITKSYKPEHGKIGSSARFEGSTEFRERFQPWEIPSPYVIKSYEYIPPKAHMQFDTTTNQDFVPHQLDYVPPIRPVSHGRRSNVPFQGNTTMKDDFRPWEAKRQELIKREHEISKPMGKFEGVTTFKSHYQPHEIIPTQSFKPQGISLRSSVPFEGGTMYRSEFTPKKNEVCPANFALPPGYVFEGVDNRGHKIFQKIPTPKMNAFGNRNENSIGIAKEIAVAS
ncbi:hypothetical protein GDO86_006348 [Hymenochirus boettgeri]|nr:hypothetical protein GDO86_006348 [Hymenochirus boettgeri]